MTGTYDTTTNRVLLYLLILGSVWVCCWTAVVEEPNLQHYCNHAIAIRCIGANVALVSTSSLNKGVDVGRPQTRYLLPPINTLSCPASSAYQVLVLSSERSIFTSWCEVCARMKAKNNAPPFPLALLGNCCVLAWSGRIDNSMTAAVNE